MIEEDRPARPWDLLNQNIGRVSQDTASKRYEICKLCEFITNITRICKKCGCGMKFKTTLPHAKCPVGKWGTSEKTEEW